MAKGGSNDREIINPPSSQIGDFAILLDSGLSVSTAALAQLATASVGVAGAGVTLALGDGDAAAFVVAPITAGGFLHLALTEIWPELSVRGDCAGDAVGIVAGFAAGAAAMMMTVAWL